MDHHYYFLLNHRREMYRITLPRRIAQYRANRYRFALHIALCLSLNLT